MHCGRSQTFQDLDDSDKENFSALGALLSGRRARLRIGPSEFAASSIGDITRIELAAGLEVGTQLARGDLAAAMYWEGYKQSEGDELYHTVWENIAGVFDFRAPFDCVLVGFNKSGFDNPDKELCFDDDIASEMNPQVWLAHVKRPSSSSLQRLENIIIFLSIGQEIAPRTRLAS